MTYEEKSAIVIEQLTNEEAIEQIKILKAFTGYDKDSPIIIKLHEALDMAIKALEAQPCIEDYPTCTECEHYDKEKHYCPRFCQVIRDTLAEAQPKKGKWIPVTERLPEGNEDVLVFDGNDYFVAWHEAQNIEMQGWCSWDASFNRYYPIKAWMPIEPYTEVEDAE